MEKVKKRWPWLLLAVVVIFLDAISKQWIIIHTAWGKALRITSFFNLQLVYNRGMAFGFFSHHATWQVIVLSILAVVVCVLLLIWMFTAVKPTALFLAALPLVIGGAIGNAVDRIMHAHVTDFLDFHLAGWHFWTFNVADLAITVGIVFLLLDWVLEGTTKTS